jgi:hypothetical protein
MAALVWVRRSDIRPVRRAAPVRRSATVHLTASCGFAWAIASLIRFAVVARCPREHGRRSSMDKVGRQRCRVDRSLLRGCRAALQDVRINAAAPRRRS